MSKKDISNLIIIHIQNHSWKAGKSGSGKSDEIISTSKNDLLGIIIPL